MAIGATSLSMVRDELFATMAETQQYLEEFLDARDNGALLQNAVTNLQQVKGILSLVELTGAELLAEEARALAMDIPVGATDDRNNQLTAINNALHVLRSYLEQLEAHRVEMPELLLPAINKLRIAGQQKPLPESFFFLPHGLTPNAQSILSLCLRAVIMHYWRDDCDTCIKWACWRLFATQARRPVCA